MRKGRSYGVRVLGVESGNSIEAGSALRCRVARPQCWSPAADLHVMELGGHSAKKVNAVPRRVPIAAISTALIGIAVEITVHLLLADKRAIWLFKPHLYAALPKPFVHTDWLSVAISVAASSMLLFWVLFRKAPAKPPLPLMWLGLGMIFGGAVGETVTGIALGTFTSILVVTRGAWGYAFGPFDVAVDIGIVLFLPGFLRDTTETYGWRELLGRGRTVSDPRR